MLQADRSLIQRRDKDEATGEVQTLSAPGRLDGMKMGDRSRRTRPPTWEEKQSATLVTLLQCCFLHSGNVEARTLLCILLQCLCKKHCLTYNFYVCWQEEAKERK